jgi:hypothetical protein
MERNRLRRFGIAAAVLVFLVAGLSHISFNVDILKLLPTHLPQVKGLSLFLKHFAQPNELIVTIEAPTAEQADAKATAIAEVLNKQPDLVARAVARAPWEKNPADLAELLAYLVLNQPPEKVLALVARLEADQTGATLKGTLEKLADSVSPQEVALLSYDPYDFAGAIGTSSFLSGDTQQSEFSPITRRLGGGSATSRTSPVPRAGRNWQACSSATPASPALSPISPAAWNGT